MIKFYLHLKDGKVIEGSISRSTFYNSLDSDLTQLFEENEFLSLHYTLECLPIAYK